MNNNVLKKRITAFSLSAIILASSGFVIFNKDIVNAGSIPKEYNTVLKVSPSGILPFNKDIRYVKSTVKGRNIDVYTIVKGEYSPVDLDYFLSLYKDKDGNYFTWRQVSEPSKTIYAGIDTDKNKVINVNLIAGSMEPIVFEANDGTMICIRFSNKFILDNGGALSDARGLFEAEYDQSKDPEGIPTELEAIAYFRAAEDPKDVKLIVESTIDKTESKTIGEIETTIQSGGVVGTNSDVFNSYGETGNAVGESVHGNGIVGEVNGMTPNYIRSTTSNSDGTPVYANNKSEGSQKTSSKKEDDIEKQLDKEIANPGGTGMTLEEALMKQREKANAGTTTGNATGNASGEGNNTTGENGSTGEETKQQSQETIDIEKYGEKEIKARFGEDTYIIKDAESFKKYKEQYPKEYGDHMTGAFLVTLTSEELEGVLKDAITYNWQNKEGIRALYTKKYKEMLGEEADKHLNDKNTEDLYTDLYDPAKKDYSDIFGDINTGWDTKYDGVGEFDNSPKVDYGEIPDYTLKQAGLDTRPTWRFKWGKAEKSNLKGLTNTNDLLLNGVYDYWEVNLMSPDMQKLDVSKFSQTPSEQLVQLPIEFEPMENSSSVLLKLSIFGLVASINMIAVFVVSRKINQTKNMEKFSKNILFKEEKLNLTSFEDDRFKLDI